MIMAVVVVMAVSALFVSSTTLVVVVVIISIDAMVYLCLMFSHLVSKNSVYFYYYII
jgi:hypothetical protein